jgi:hypothetical protein
MGAEYWPTGQENLPLARQGRRVILAGIDEPTRWRLRGRIGMVVAIRIGVAVSIVVCLASCEPDGNGRASMTTTRATDATTATGGPAGISERNQSSFFAVTGDSTRLVEIDLATGEVLRTVVDVRQTDGGFVAIDGLDVASDRRTAYYSVTTERGHESVYRVNVPDGTPERLADGSGPSISTDGSRLSFVSGTVIHVRDLRTGEDRTYPDAVGELGGSDTTWSPDGQHLAFATHAADSVGGTNSIDIASGTTIHPQPATPDPTRIYAAYSARYRPSDGLLAVICCEVPNVDPDDPRHGRSLVLHDPATGTERARLALLFRAGSIAFGADGREALFTSFPEGKVYHHRDDTFRVVPGLVGVILVDW